MGRWEAGAGGLGREVATAVENCPEKLHSENKDTRAVHLVSREAQ